MAADKQDLHDLVANLESPIGEIRNAVRCLRILGMDMGEHEHRTMDSEAVHFVADSLERLATDLDRRFDAARRRSWEMKHGRKSGAKPPGDESPKGRPKLQLIEGQPREA